MKIWTLLAISLTVALGMPPGEEVVPGPMEEDGPPAQVTVEDVTPVPEDQQSQARGGRKCPGLTHGRRCYQFFRGPRRAITAEVFCRKLSSGGHLASITSQKLHREVLRLVLRANGRSTHVWVGGLRIFTTSRFVWLDGSSWTYADWLPGRPKRTSSFDNCVELLANGKFNDRSCREAQAFICSYPQ